MKKFWLIQRGSFRDLNSMKSSMKHFEEKYTKFDKGSIVLYTAESSREEYDTEVLRTFI